ncbi:MAG: dTDP-4-amino-4,6-dideoxy-D-galactose acyltransferase [Alteromonadaceae bacterium]|jgi:dTDP-4-amino-4,6-dideoxy-D-galactose acyltransferase
MFKNFYYKKWDSEFFKKPIFEYSANYNNEIERLPIGSLLTAKIDSKIYSDLDYVNNLGFNFCEGELLFKKSLESTDDLIYENDYHDYIADNNSLEELKVMVKYLYEKSRFRQPWFSADERSLFYQTWIENTILFKFDDCCLVLQSNNEIAAFITIRVRGAEASIGLVGVKPKYQGQGFGKRILQLGEKYCTVNGAKSIRVATQMSNVSAAQLYSKNNYNLSDTYYWFYKKV